MSRDDRDSDNNSASTGVFGALLILLALVLVVGPFFIPEKFHVTGMAHLAFAAFGVLLLLGGSLMIAFSQYYRKATSSRSFIRTGRGGAKVVIDGGAMVIRQIHQVQYVSMETVKLTIERFGKDSLLTSDNLRIDVRAEFYIAVAKTPDGVKAAARTLGDKAGDDEAILKLVGDKLISAMRTVAARNELSHLHSKLDEYKSEVKTIVEHDLEPNGLALETVAVSHLNQTAPAFLDPVNNLFDAQGARKIAQIVNEQLIAKSQIETEAAQQVKQFEVTRDQALFTLEVTRQTAEATKDTSIANAEAEQRQLAAKFAAEQTQLSGIARVTSEQTVALAEVAKDQAVRIAEQKRDQASQEAGIAKEQAVEVKKREQQVAVAEAEKARATAEANRITAETVRETANQAMLTVTESKKAERNKITTVIAQEAAAAIKKIEQNMTADVAAYSTIKNAEADQEAAAKQAQATLTLAKANQESRSLEAKGESDYQMIPVNVNQAQVAVDAAQVDVLKARLAAQTANEKMAFELQVELAKIAADQAVRTAQAVAFGQGLAAADLRFFGDTASATKVFGSFMGGQNAGAYMEGLIHATPGEVKDLAVDTIQQFSGAASAVAKRLFGKDIPAEDITNAVRAELANQQGGKEGGVESEPKHGK